MDIKHELPEELVKQPDLNLGSRMQRLSSERNVFSRAVVPVHSYDLAEDTAFAEVATEQANAVAKNKDFFMQNLSHLPPEALRDLEEIMDIWVKSRDNVRRALSMWVNGNFTSKRDAARNVINPSGKHRNHCVVTVDETDQNPQLGLGRLKIGSTSQILLGDSGYKALHLEGYSDKRFLGYTLDTPYDSKDVADGITVYGPKITKEARSVGDQKSIYLPGSLFGLMNNEQFMALPNGISSERFLTAFLSRFRFLLGNTLKDIL